MKKRQNPCGTPCGLRPKAAAHPTREHPAFPARPAVSVLDLVTIEQEEFREALRTSLVVFKTPKNAKKQWLRQTKSLCSKTDTSKRKA